tara:strand:+ start:123 stop:560 length:438 start_codon:yes stop_codon:yes gene_type:complete
MTEPLNKEVAKKYGYNEEDFRSWTKRYIDSLNLDTLNFKPIMNLAERLQYVIDINANYFTLNSNYIYLLNSHSNKNTHFIPIGEPFYHQKRDRGAKMDGLYVVKGDKHTYTNKGLNQDNYTIIGVAPFPKTIIRSFLNWKENPLP